MVKSLKVAKSAKAKNKSESEFVRIVMTPVMKPMHFTAAEIRRAVLLVIAAEKK